jgi:hypothetical protein
MDLTAGSLDAMKALQAPGALAGATAADLLAALTTVHHVRAYLDQWEPALIGAARSHGLTWAQIAPALGLSSRQAAERRYLRLNPQIADQPGTTREHRVRATRDQRSGDRAVADWARRNAAELRQIAGQISAIGTGTDLPPAARDSVDRTRSALGGHDPAELIGPLAEAGPALRTSHPALADQIAAIGTTIDMIRTADRTRRTTSGGNDQ